MNTFALRTGDFTHLVTSINGHVEEIVVKIDVLRLSADEPADPTCYIIGHCLYFGNGSDTMFNDCCGGVIWTDDFGVIEPFGITMKDESVTYSSFVNSLMELNHDNESVRYFA